MVMFAFRPSDRRWLAPAAALIALLTVTASASGQIVVDPRIAEFDASADHFAMLPDGTPIVTRYTLNIYMAGAAEPFHVVDLGKPAPQSDGKIRADFSQKVTAWPLPGGTYEARVAAVGPAGVSMSTPSNFFTFSMSSDTPTTRVLWQHPTGPVVIWKMVGGLQVGHFSVEERSTVWTVVGNGDFDADGVSDIVWQAPNGRVVVWFLGDDYVKGTAVVADHRTEWKVVATGDFNGDDRCDLVWQYPTGQVVVWFMAGVQKMGSATLYGGATAWKVVSAGDMNDDGNSDLIWQAATGEVVVWFFDRETKIGADYLSSIPSEWVVVATADLNADGHQDLVWQHPTGRTLVWFMDNLVKIGWMNIYNGQTAWRVAGC